MEGHGPQMNIIDSQVHVWPTDRPDRRLGKSGLDRTPFGYDELLAAMGTAGVDRAILVPPSFEGDRNDYVLEGVRKHPDRFAIMGRVALQSGGGRKQLKGWRDQPGMLGVRLTFHRDEDRPWLTDGTADCFWDEAEQNGIPVMVHAPERLPVIAEIAARHPALRIIVDHIGFARETTDDATNAGADRMLALAHLPNVYVKVPCTPDGIKACRILSGEGTHVNVALVFSAPQAIIAAKAAVVVILDTKFSFGEVTFTRSSTSACRGRFLDDLGEVCFAARRSELPAPNVSPCTDAAP